MTRIYNSESSNNSYKARDRRVNYAPTQVASNERKIAQQGERKLQDLKTKQRETVRADQMQNAETQARDKTELLTLQALQQQENHRLALEQKNESYTLANKQQLAKADLTMSQTTERGKTSIQQLSDNSSLKLSQMMERDALALKNAEENAQMSREQRARQADMNLQAQHLRLSQQVESANTALVGSTINSLISFAGTVATEVAERNEEQRIKEEKIAAQDWIFSGGAGVTLPDGSINPVIPAEAAQRDVEVAQEQAVVQTNPGNPIAQESVRGPAADLTAQRNQNQASLGQIASRARDDLWTAYNSPETRVTLSDGRVIAPTEARTPQEVNEVLTRLGGALAATYGLEGRDKFAVVTQLAPEINKGISEIRANVLPGVVNSIQEERKGAALNNAAGIVENTGDLQEAWNVISSGYLSSGAFNGDRSKANEAAFDDLIALVDDDQLAQMADIHKVTQNGIPQKGTSFGADRSGKWADKIQNEQNRRMDADWNAETRRSRAATLEIKEAKNDLTSALIEAAGDLEATQAAHLEYESRLAGLNTTEARTELLAAQAAPNNYNPATFTQLRERVASGELLDKAELQGQLRRGEINAQEYNSLVGMGATTTLTDIEQVVGQRGIKNADKLIETTVTRALLPQFGNDSTLAAAGTASIADDAKRRLYPELGAFISNYEAANGRKPTEGEVSQFVNGWVADFASTDLANVNYEQETGLTGYNYLGTGPRPAAQPKTVINPVTGKEAQGLAHLSAANLANSRDSVNISSDYVLTQKEISDNLAQLESGQWTPSLVNKARALGVTPMTLLRGQTQAQGLGDVSRIQRTPAGGNSGGAMDLQSGADYLHKTLDFSEKGAAYLSGNIMQESSWNGQRSWGEVMGDGTSRNGGLVSWASWSDDPARLGRIENYLGKDISAASNAEQLAAMQWEMKTYYPNQYRIFRNPQATDAQLRRASKAYWGYGEEGYRFEYAAQAMRG